MERELSERYHFNPADFGEDGGTCNFDSPSLLLPRWQEKKIKQAAKEALAAERKALKEAQKAKREAKKATRKQNQ